jgi:hypothetical protein
MNSPGSVLIAIPLAYSMYKFDQAFLFPRQTKNDQIQKDNIHAGMNKVHRICKKAFKENI